MKFSILLMLLLTMVASAQKPSKRTCRILFLNGPDHAPSSLYLFDGARSQQVDLPRMNFSQVYHLRQGDITLRLASSAISDPKKIPAGLPKVQVAKGINDFYILISSDPENKKVPVSILVVKTGKRKLKRGEMLWVNMTKNAIGGAVGSEKLIIRPKSQVILKPPARGNEDYLVNLDFIIPGNQHRYPLCEVKWRHDPRSRNVAFIYSEKGRRTPRVLVFPDYREANKKQP